MAEGEVLGMIDFEEYETLIALARNDIEVEKVNNAVRTEINALPPEEQDDAKYRL
jgi:hypothetical protein